MLCSRGLFEIIVQVFQRPGEVVVVSTPAPLCTVAGHQWDLSTDKAIREAQGGAFLLMALWVPLMAS
jgi:hypothetical protein